MNEPLFTNPKTEMPTTVVGWVVMLLALSVAYMVFLAIDARDYVADQTLMLALPYAIIFLLTAGWIAAYTIGSDRRT